MSNIKLGSFSTKTGFILVAAGSAIGLGNIWRFPYLFSAGGMGFLIYYLIFLLIFALPSLFVALLIGQIARTNFFGIYDALGVKSFKFIGVLHVVAQILTLGFYAVVGGWTIIYFFAELGALFFGTSILGLGEIFSNPLLNAGFGVLFLICTAIVIAFGVQKGVERVAKILLPLLWVLLIFLLLVVMFFVPGYWHGFSALFTFHAQQFSFNNMSLALGQTAFTLSLGMGTMITYGAYAKQKTVLSKSSLIIAVLNFATSFVAALVIIPSAVAFGHHIKGGPGLTFATMPEIFSNFAIGHFLGAIFFLLLFIAALTSLISVLQPNYDFVRAKLPKLGNVGTVISQIIVYAIISSVFAFSMAPHSMLVVGSGTLFDFVSGPLINTFFIGSPLLLSLMAGYFVWDKLENKLKEDQTHPLIVTTFKWIIRIVAPVLLAGYLVIQFL